MAELARPRQGDAEDLVAQVETGARSVPGGVGAFITGLTFLWSAFQIFVASDVPYWIEGTFGLKVILNNLEIRFIHLAFASALAALAYPLLRGSPRHRVPWYDWLLAILGVGSCLYLLVFKDAIANRAGLPTTGDLVASSVGMAVLAISVYRALGLPLVVVASVFVAYVFFGDASWLPETIQWKGASYGKALWHFWMQSEGVFGVALGVSASMIFLFVLFGGLLEKAGAGNYFVKLSFALLGHMRGGPAKAAVVASALSGIYSGSSIANVVTTGTFTIPLMKRTGFPPEKAGAVEVASSTNGQLTPPVMGAAAFLIAEFTGVPYTDIIRHAVVPAVVSYIALVYIVHLEALKLDLRGLPKPPSQLPFLQRIIGVLFGFIAMAALAAVVYYGLGWIKDVIPDLTLPAVLLLILAAYLVLLNVAARHPDLELDDPNAQLIELPRPGEVAVTGLHFILPIVVLIWCILIERLSPSTSAYFATLTMIFIAVTQRPLKAMFRGTGQLLDEFRTGVGDFVEGMIAGARNMISIGVATGAAGIIVGTVSLTGLHQVVGEFVEFLSGGSLIVMLLLVAVMSLLLGMGLPTTANYIVVSALMAPVIVSVGAANGLLVPLVAVHMFVFYFGILADDTPPVGLAAFAAAAISGGDPIKTGFQGFGYDIRTALLPFLFIFNTELLLIDVTVWKAIFVFCVAVVAMMLFAAATQGYFLTRNRIWESVLLLLVAFTLFRPGFWLDQVDPPFEERPGAEVFQIAGAMPAGSALRITISGPDFDHPERIDSLTVSVPMGPAGDGAARLMAAGLTVEPDGDKALVGEPLPGTAFFKRLQDFDFYADDPVTVATVELERERIAKEVFYIPALLVLVLVVLLQRRRQTMPAFWG